MKSTAKLVLRIQCNCVGLQLTTMLEKSGKLEMILDLTYYDEDFSALVVEINIDKDEEALNKKSTNLTDDCKYVNFKASSGSGADANKLPLLYHFGVPVDNLQTLQLLFQELKQLLENNKEGLIISTSVAQEGNKEAYVQVPVGYS